MTLLAVTVIAGAGIVMSVLVALAERFRSRWLQIHVQSCTPAITIDPHSAVGARSRNAVFEVTKESLLGDYSESPATSHQRVFVDRQLLEILEDDLQQDIAEWEAVLNDFPQVIGASAFIDRADFSVSPDNDVPSAAPRRDLQPLGSDPESELHSSEEQGMIMRLARSGFSPSEIAVWMQLPMEFISRVLHEG